MQFATKILGGLPTKRRCDVRAVLTSAIGIVLCCGCGQAPSVPAGIAATDPFQKAVLKHLESNERGVQVLEWYPPESLQGAYFIPKKHVDADDPADKQEKWVSAAETEAATNGRAVRCVYKTDIGFGAWSGEQDMVFLVTHDLRVINYAISEEFTTVKPGEVPDERAKR